MIFNPAVIPPLFRHEFFTFLQNSHMNQSDTLTAQTPFQFSAYTENTSMVERKIFAFEHNKSGSAVITDTHLKTPEEIEAELSFELNAKKSMFQEHNDMLDTYGRMIKNKDGNSNTYSPDGILSGFMEENY